MPGRASDNLRDSQLLSAAVKLVRRSSGLSSREVAQKMHIALRTYQRFEGGLNRLNLDHIHRFAKATSSDPYALLIAVMIGAPRFALNAASNNLATILMVAVQNLDQSLGDRIAELETRDLISAITKPFDALAAQVLATDPSAEWLARGRTNLNIRRPKPGR